MRISGINPGMYNKYNPNFGHKIIFDFGASSPKVTAKCLVTTNDGQPLYFKDGFYLNNTIRGFKNGNAFIDRVSQLVKTTYDETLQRSKKGEFELPEDEKKLSGVSIFIPGTTMTNGKDDIIAFMPNIKDTEGKSLVNIDFSEYENQLKSGKLPIEVSDDFELFVTKDLGGTGLGLAKVLGAKGMLKEGDYIMGVMTGGGFGSVDVKVKDGKVEIETSESSSYLTASPKEGKLEKLGRLGVSVKSHINHFCNVLDIPELAKDSPLRKAMIAAGDARIVEENAMHVKDNELIKLFESEEGKRVFRVKEEKPNETVFEIKADDEVSAKKLLDARISSIKDYAAAVSLISVNKINDCLNKIILVGPFAHGVNKYVKSHPEYFSGDPEYQGDEIKDLPDLIKHEVTNRISPEGVDLPSSRWLRDLYHFDVICDNDTNFSDNTYAGALLLDPELKFVENRGSWFSFPLSLVQKDNNEQNN